MSTSSESSQAPIAQRLAQAMAARDMTAAELSRLTNISTAALSHYLNKRYKPKQDKLDALAKALRVNPAWLRGYNVDMEADSPLPDAPPPLPLDKIPSRSDVLTFLEYQQLKFDKLLDLTKSIESAIHHNTAFAEKYLRLTPFNQEIINTTIDTMLKTQLATSTEEDARASANEKARPGTGELYEERYPNEEGG
ncbi:helix-turn-helix transcriptional regulator [Selenomonas sp. AB3002]|uniref:helix-turn-helix domain-containing protein n=1 Tax=Selenomonas sp. AB3002 TaxID=1392502 RepID=UPI0006924E23